MHKSPLISIQVNKTYLEFPDIEKWFSLSPIHDLSVIKYCILQLPLGRNREFFLLAFFAIIRRVSRAYDGEESQGYDCCHERLEPGYKLQCSG